jgi:solute carrier family 1 (neuronal/epithelial high affinity glutamate transporter), member 1
MPIQMVVAFFTATLAAIDAAGIPGAGLLTMVMVMMSVDLPFEGISLILVLDWFLDRFRTVINVWYDPIAAAVIDRFEMLDNNKITK